MALTVGSPVAIVDFERWRYPHLVGSEEQSEAFLEAHSNQGGAADLDPVVAEQSPAMGVDPGPKSFSKRLKINRPPLRVQPFPQTNIIRMF